MLVGEREPDDLDPMLGDLGANIRRGRLLVVVPQPVAVNEASSSG